MLHLLNCLTSSNNKINKKKNRKENILYKKNEKIEKHRPFISFPSTSICDILVDVLFFPPRFKRLGDAVLDLNDDCVESSGVCFLYAKSLNKFIASGLV